MEVCIVLRIIDLIKPGSKECVGLCLLWKGLCLLWSGKINITRIVWGTGAFSISSEGISASLIICLTLPDNVKHTVLTVLIIKWYWQPISFWTVRCGLLNSSWPVSCIQPDNWLWARIYFIFSIISTYRYEQQVKKRKVRITQIEMHDTGINKHRMKVYKQFYIMKQLNR